ncbi:MAG: hypothetical protein WBQ69_07920 [Gallionella sp.]
MKMTEMQGAATADSGADDGGGLFTDAGQAELLMRKVRITNWNRSHHQC